MPNLVGQDLGRYHITEQLGEGGMATVYKAFDARLERNVALKIIRTDVSGGEGGDMLKRFEREAKALAQLTHPNIVHIDDYGEQAGMPYVVMDYLPGGTLKQKLGRPMPYDEAARWLAPIARALEYAHQQKIIHRDVKPANILLTQSGAPMLTDFGIAKILESKDHTELTGTGVGLGTPDYMAPEQWFGKAEARTDIYALGIVFYELVTGRRPFSADTPAAVLIKHVNDPLPDPRQYVGDIPGRVEQVLLKALAKNVEDRYQTMGEFAAALEQLSAPPRADRTQLAAPLPAAGGTTVLVPGMPPAGRSTQRLAQSQVVYTVQGNSQPSLRTPPPLPPPAVVAPVVEARGGLSRNASITIGVIALIALCLAGALVGGIALYTQFSTPHGSATSTLVAAIPTAIAESTSTNQPVDTPTPTVQDTAPATATEVAATPVTPVPPSRTAAVVLPTWTSTRIPPTFTATPRPTATRTHTPVPPTATKVPSATPTHPPVTAVPILTLILRQPLPIFLLPTATPTPTSLFILHPISPILKP